MKKFVWFLIGAVVGLVAGGLFGYQYILTVVSENMTSIVGDVVSSSSGSGALDQYQGQISDMISEQKDLVQENIQEAIKEYLQEQLDGLF